MKPFNELKDDNGSALKTYVELLMEKAADKGLLSVIVFVNPDEKAPKCFHHYASNIDNFADVLALSGIYARSLGDKPSAPPVPAPEKEIKVVKGGK